MARRAGAGPGIGKPSHARRSQNIHLLKGAFGNTLRACTDSPRQFRNSERTKNAVSVHTGAPTEDTVGQSWPHWEIDGSGANFAFTNTPTLRVAHGHQKKCSNVLEQVSHEDKAADSSSRQQNKTQLQASVDSK